MEKRFTDKDVQAACDAFNIYAGLKSGDIGALYYADVDGNGYSRRPRVWQVCTVHGGVRDAYLKASTRRETIARIRAYMVAHKTQAQRDAKHAAIVEALRILSLPTYGDNEAYVDHVADAKAVLEKAV